LGGSCKLQSIVKIYGQQKHTVHKTLTMSNRNNKTRQRLRHLRWLKIESGPIPTSIIQDRCVEHVWDREFSVAIGDGDDDTGVSGLRCYTDGSLMTNLGSGVAIFRHGVPAPIYTD
jgi:hypothetical protein